MARVTLEELGKRITRMETRLVNGLTQLGLDPCTKLEEGDIVVDASNMKVYISNISLTIGTILYKLAKEDSPHGVYTVFCGDDPCLEITYRGESNGVRS